MPNPRPPIRSGGLLAAAALLLLAIAAGSCQNTPTGPELVGGRYDYAARDSADALVVVGTIVLRNNDSTALTGTWDLRKVGPAGEVGPQTGLGTLAGSTAGGVLINLNPGIADDNVMLSGTFDKGKITGTWQWVTFAGVTAEGSFEMTK